MRFFYNLVQTDQSIYQIPMVLYQNSQNTPNSRLPPPGACILIVNPDQTGTAFSYSIKKNASNYFAFLVSNGNIVYSMSNPGFSQAQYAFSNVAARNEASNKTQDQMLAYRNPSFDMEPPPSYLASTVQANILDDNDKNETSKSS
jgi:hypothetical protein